MSEKKQPPTLPTVEQYLELTRHAVRNAGEQLASARALLDASQWPVAFAVAALGLEELGKANICIINVALPDGAAMDAKTFKWMLSDHRPKAFFAQFALQGLLADEIPDEVDVLLQEVFELSQQTNDTKFRGLYVDLDANGEARWPTLEVSEERARWVVGELSRLYEAMQSWGGDEDLAKFAALAHAIRDTLDVEALRGFFRSDEEGALKTIREAMRDENEDLARSMLERFTGLSDIEAIIT